MIFFFGQFNPIASDYCDCNHRPHTAPIFPIFSYIFLYFWKVPIFPIFWQKTAIFPINSYFFLYIFFFLIIYLTLIALTCLLKFYFQIFHDMICDEGVRDIVFCGEIGTSSDVMTQLAKASEYVFKFNFKCFIGLVKSYWRTNYFLKPRTRLEIHTRGSIVA